MIYKSCTHGENCIAIIFGDIHKQTDKFAHGFIAIVKSKHIHTKQICT